MTVAHIQHALSLRSVAEALASRPYVDRQIAITTSKQTKLPWLYPLVAEAFDSVYRAVDTSSALLRIARQERVDVVHAHNWPDTPTCLALEARDAGGRFAVIHDLHDRGTSLHLRADPEEERRAEQESDAILFAGEQAQREIGSGHRPSIVLHCKPLARFLPPIPRFRRHARAWTKRRRGHFACAGLLRTEPGSHRNYLDILSEILRDRHLVDLFPSTPPAPIYRLLRGCRVLNAGSMDRLFRRLAHYTGGILARPRSEYQPYWPACMPHRLFDYPACGIPVVTDVTSDAIASYVEAERVGVVLHDWRRIQVGALEEIREGLLRDRERFILEGEVSRLVGLYRDLT